jgi:hypothetical protein
MVTRPPAAVCRFQGSRNDFKDALSSWAGATVVIFHSAGFGSCPRLRQLLPSIAADFPSLQFMAFDVDQAKPIAAQVDAILVPMTNIFEMEFSEIPTQGAILGEKLPEIRKTCKPSLFHEKSVLVNSNLLKASIFHKSFTARIEICRRSMRTDGSLYKIENKNDI